MADIFFYTNPEKIGVQTGTNGTDEAFGPIDTNKFQITSRHKATPDSKVIAVVDGTIVAVDQSTVSNEITLILRPSKSISEITKLDLPDIKYIIYKGVKRSSIVTGSLISQDPDPSKRNDLTIKIHDTQLKNNASFGTTGEPGLKTLRLDVAPADPSKYDIDELFDVETDPLFALTKVKAGDYIGDFLDASEGSFGVEFVLNEVRAKVFLNEVRENNFIIDVTGKTGVDRKNSKERILYFLDPTTFYGSLFPIRSKDVIGDKAVGEIICTRSYLDVFDNFDGLKVYEKCMVNLKNRNRIYIDIRNELNNSYNFLGVYSDEIIIRKGKGGIGLPATNYYTHFNDWPILGVENTEFLPISMSGNEIDISIQLSAPNITGDNDLPIALLYCDYKKIGKKGVKRIKPNDKVNILKIDSPSSSGPYYYKELNFKVPNYHPSVGTLPTTAISSYIRIKIFREESHFSPDVTIHRPENYFDNLIMPFACRRSYASGLEIKTFQEDIYMGTNVSIPTIVDEDGGKPDTNFISSVGYAFDDFNTTLFTFVQRRRTRGRRLIQIPRREYRSTGSFLNVLNERFTVEAGASDDLLGVVDLDIPSNTGEIYRFLDPKVTSLDTDFSDLSTEFSAIILSNTSYNAMKSSIGIPGNDINPNYDVFLVLRNRDEFQTSLTSDPTNLHHYHTYEVYLRGFQEVGSGSGLSAVEWNSGITLFSYAYEGEVKSKNFILVEEGVILSGIASDRYLPCLKSRLSDEEMIHLDQLRDRIKQDSESTTPFKPNVDLYEKVFRHSTNPLPYFMWVDSVTGKVYFKKTELGVTTTLNELPNYQVKGFIFEAATIFAIWNLCSLMADETKENYLYERLFRILHNNGLNPDKVSGTSSTTRRSIKSRLFNPFNHYGQRYAYPDPIKMAHPTLGDVLVNTFDSDRQYIFVDFSNFQVNTLDSVEKAFNEIIGTSFKEELFNIIRAGNLKSISNNAAMAYTIHRQDGDDFDSRVLFDIPDSIRNLELLLNTTSTTGVYGTFDDTFQIESQLDNTVRKFIEPLVGKICREITNELKFLILRNARCYYKLFTENLSFNETIIPETRMLASGEGSTTNGLTNPKKYITIKLSDKEFPLPNPMPLGAMLYTYKLDKFGNPLGVNTESFPQINSKKPISVHLTIFGQDGGLAPNVVDIEINSVSGKTEICRFVGYVDDVDPQFNKLFPVHSNTRVPVGVDPYINYNGGTVGGTFYPGDPRVKLSSNGTYIIPLNGGATTLPDKVNTSFNFTDGDKVVGTYLAEWNNLIIQRDEPYTIKVTIYSGNTLSVFDITRPTNSSPRFPVGNVIPRVPFMDPSISPTPDLLDFDEIQVGINISESEPINIVEVSKLSLDADNLYSDDKFELSKVAKLNLINQSNEIESSYKKLAKLISDGTISPDNIAITLNGYNIGRRESELNPLSTTNKIVRDFRFAFSPERPRPATLGWDEGLIVIDPNEGVTYHPNDVDHDKTRLLEVATGLSEEDLKVLRSSSGEITVIYFDAEKASLNINIESFVSPIWSRLDKGIVNDYRHGGGGSVEGMTSVQRKALVDSFTLYGDGTLGSDAFVNTPDGIRPSYNPVLSCLRSFGLLEAVKDNIIYMAGTQIFSPPSTTEYEDTTVLTPSEITALEAILQTKIDEIIIEANQFIGYTQDVTYDLYKKLKWYEDSVEEALYGTL